MKDQPIKKVWGMPLLLGLLTVFGLLSALLGNGVWYLLSWIAMAIPVIVMIWKIWRNYTISKNRAAIK